MLLDDEVILERARNVRYKGMLEAYDRRAVGDNPFCGDSLEVRIQFQGEGDSRVVSQAQFEGYACTLCLACADALMEYSIGKTSEQLLNLTYVDVLHLWEDLQVGRTRRGCVELALTVLKRALAETV